MLHFNSIHIQRIMTSVVLLVLFPFGYRTDSLRNTELLASRDAWISTEYEDFQVESDSAQIEELLRRMTTEEKIGQAMLIGFSGRELSPALSEMIREYHIGGVVLVSRNISSPEGVAELTNTLQAEATGRDLPGLLVAIDEEGGKVSRLKEYRGFTEFPSAMAIAAASNVDNAFEVGRSKATELKSLGINTNLAPVLDVNNNPSNPVIGIRSFSSDTQQVAEYGVAMMLGMQSEGIIAVGKHFPGHGDTSVDSHLFLPVIPYDMQRLLNVELVPFQAAIDAGIAGIMSGHIRFTTIDDTPDMAATLSPPVLTGLLRHEMGFDGLTLTDSLEMGALAMSGYPAPLAAALAFQAGADLLLFDHKYEDQKAAFRLINTWVESGRIPQARLDEAVRRILRTKIEYGLLHPAAVDVDGYEDAIDEEANKELSRSIAYDSITLLRDRDGLLPLQDGEKILVITIPGARRLGSLLGADELYISNIPTREEIEYIDRVIQLDYSVVILTTANIQTHPGQALLANRLLENDVPLAIAAMSGPYDVMYFPQAGTYLASYGANPPSRTALAAVLKGEYQPCGHLPVDIPGMYPLGYGMHGFAGNGQCNCEDSSE